MKPEQQHETDKYQHVNRTEIYEDRATKRNRQQIPTCKQD